MNLSQQLVDLMQSLDRSGLNTGRSGNASARTEDNRFVITPSGIHPRELDSRQIVTLDLTAEEHPADVRPSSEWRMHRDIYRNYPAAEAIVHTHSPYATALACTRRNIPAFHYMVAVAGGDSIECARYATFGTEALSQAVITALCDRSACLLANHGMIAYGPSTDAAADLAMEVEQLAKQYAISLMLGEPTLLNVEEMSEVLEKFQSYGQRTG